MAPFTYTSLLGGFKERIESIIPQGDKVYIGTSTGNLHTYSVQQDGEWFKATVVEVKRSLTRRSIDQLGYIKDVNSLVILSDLSISLYSETSVMTPLTQARGAMSFGVNTTVQHLLPNGEAADSPNSAEGVPTVVTLLVVGCSKKVVIYTWKDGESQDVKELALPHSPRAVTFLTPDTLVLSYTHVDHVLFSIKKMSFSEILLPSTSTGPTGIAMGMGMGMGRGMSLGMGALSGLGASLGLREKEKPSVMKIGEGEVAITKDNTTFFIGVDGRLNRTQNVEWPARPDDTAFVKPYILTAMPPGSVPSSHGSVLHLGFLGQQTIPSSVLQIRSALSLSPVQTLPFPPSGPLATPPQQLRLLTPSPSSKSPLYLVSTPTEKVAAAEGSTIWVLSMQSWGAQVDELLDAGSYTDALALLDTIDRALLDDKIDRIARIRALQAVSLFSQKKFDDAVNIFIELEVNPAKVIALYPEVVSGRLHVDKSEWIALFGGKKVAKKDGDPQHNDKDHETTTASSDDGAAHADAKTKDKLRADELHKSIETLMRYLSDRRQKISGALTAMKISPSSSSSIPFLSETSTADLFALPNSAPSHLQQEQLLRFAQIVDTALFKSYLENRPSLIGSLCRIDNWCEVSEVEEVLRERNKFAELVDLYKGKKMHQKALSLLKDMDSKETDKEDQLGPTIRYLQKLGPEYLDLIFSSSDWVFAAHKTMGLQIFTAEEVQLPRNDVATHLRDIDPDLCIRYLEHVINEWKDETPSFHDWLAELYFDAYTSPKLKSDEEGRKKVHSKLLAFINSSTHYRADRLFTRLPSNDLFEVRAVLLGRLGQHEGALEIYAYRLQDYAQAEEYCKKVYAGNPDPHGIFLTLLRIYLRPSSTTAAPTTNLLRPALELISRHSPRLDAFETLELLPTLVTASDVRTFLMEALREPKIETRVMREIWKARDDWIDRKLLGLQSKRVRITESRICPQCHKRLGNSVIAVHSPRGEVTHYQCREAFAQKIQSR